MTGPDVQYLTPDEFRSVINSEVARRRGDGSGATPGVGCCLPPEPARPRRVDRMDALMVDPCDAPCVNPDTGDHDDDMFHEDIVERLDELASDWAHVFAIPKGEALTLLYNAMADTKAGRDVE